MAAKKKVSTAEIGEMIDALSAERDVIRRLETEVNKLKKAYSESETSLREALVGSKLDSAGGSGATASVGERQVPKIEDYRKLEAYIYKNKALDLFQNRPSITAVREHVEQLNEGRNPKLPPKGVPGISIMKIPTLNLRKRK